MTGLSACEADLLKRIATAGAVLSAVFLIRATLRAVKTWCLMLHNGFFCYEEIINMLTRPPAQFQMFLYPDQPAPPDMMFPG